MNFQDYVAFTNALSRIVDLLLDLVAATASTKAMAPGSCYGSIVFQGNTEDGKPYVAILHVDANGEVDSAKLEYGNQKSSWLYKPEAEPKFVSG